MECPLNSLSPSWCKASVSILWNLAASSAPWKYLHVYWYLKPWLYLSPSPSNDFFYSRYQNICWLNRILKRIKKWALLILSCLCVWGQTLKNTGNFLHGGATATLVDLVGSAVIYTVGAPVTGVSVEINVSYLDAAYAGVSALLCIYVQSNMFALLLLSYSSTLKFFLLLSLFYKPPECCWLYQLTVLFLCLNQFVLFMSMFEYS